MKTVRDISTLRGIIRSWRQDGETVALVPTMGSLHQGHMSLIQLASESAERVIASVFVNPTQFGPTEDFKDYPRTLDMDRRRLSRAGADVMFVPDSKEIYPFGEKGMTSVSVPGLSTILCGEHRPGHFDGVTSVVSRLLNIVQPDVAIFGQKDYQQLVIIRRMVSDLHLPVRILAGQTHREDDGLALSSRNRYLDDKQRIAAPGLFNALNICRTKILGGNTQYEQLQQEAMDDLRTLGFEPEYFEVRQAADISMPVRDSTQLVILAAVRIGAARLIDNLLLEIEKPARKSRR